jgi:vacuolar protein sorting-associated protein VTA1
MPLSIPPELKKITPYVRRAEELDRDKGNPESRLVAFYCRQYAVHSGISLATSSVGKTCLGELLGNLEGEKVAMDSFTRDEAKFLCSKFANKVFDRADLDDRTGESTRDTAKTFYAAASFLEILNQFYKDDDESEEVGEIKKRGIYAKWKATDILKAIKEGRPPTSGGYGEEAAEEEEEEEEEEEGGKESTGPPNVETVSDDEDAQPEPEPEPMVRPPPVEDEEESEDEGTEVALSPPPAYPFEPMASPPAAAPVVYKPPLTFNPPAAAPPMPAPPTAKPKPPSESPKKSSGFFGIGGKKKKKVSKADIADAMELTQFAMAALEDKNADLAGERLQQALQALGR